MDLIKKDIFQINSGAKTTDTIAISLIRMLSARASGVLERVSDRVTGDCRLVCRRTFSAEMTLFDVFLRVVPCTAGVCHHDGNDKTAGD